MKINKLKTALLLFIFSSTALMGVMRAGGDRPMEGRAHDDRALREIRDDRAISPAQKRLIEEQDETYVPFDADEENYLEETNPEQDINQGGDFYLKDHPLQERPLQEEPIN